MMGNACDGDCKDIPPLRAVLGWDTVPRKTYSDTWIFHSPHTTCGDREPCLDYTNNSQLPADSS